MSYEFLQLEADGDVRVLTLHRPKALNALNSGLLGELRCAVQELASDPAARALVLTGSGGKAFVAGADIAEMVNLTPVEAHAFARLGQQLMSAIEELPFPVIAAVNGFALGGGLELAMACDLIVASGSAKFGQPEINLGILPGFGGTQRLPRRVGPGAARRLIFTGDMIGAEEALRLGLVDVLVAEDDALPEARALATRLAGKAPVALRRAKATLAAAGDVSLADGCRLEAEAFGLTFSTSDRAEGMRAFLDRRPATFTGA